MKKIFMILAIIILAILLFLIIYKTDDRENISTNNNNQNQNNNNQNQENQENNQNNGEVLSIDGKYVTSKWDTPVTDKDILDNKLTEGVFLRTKWKKLQSTKDTYDFSIIKTQVEAAAKYNKKVSIGIMAGSATPDYIYSEGVKGLNFIELPNQGKIGTVINIKIPIPWDATYLKEFNKLNIKLAEYLKKNDLYKHVSIIKISGINEDSAEIRLPAQKSITSGGNTSTDAIAIWKEENYKFSLVKGAWTNILNNYKTTFPDKYLSMSVIPTRGFPGIDESGSEYTVTTSNDPSYELIDIAQSIIGKNFAVQFNALDAKLGGDIQKMMKYSDGKNIITGYQLNQQKYGNACTVDAGCTAENLKAAFILGYSLNAKFIEVFEKTVTTIPAGFN